MTTSKVPRLRFPGFNDNWQTLPLNTFLVHSKTKNKDLEFDKSEVLSVAAEVGVVNQIAYHGRSYAGASVAPYGIILKGEMAYTKSPLKKYPYGIMKLNECQDGIVSTLYAIYRVKPNASGKFLDYYFYHPHRINRYLKPLVSIGAKNDMKVNNDYAISGQVTVPNLTEQDKIASFLSVVDEKIDLLAKNKELLEKYKKWVMQQIFSQKIRLKDKNGQNYPDWDKKTLEEVIKKFSTGLNPRKNFTLGKGENSYITIKNIKSGKLDFSSAEKIDNNAISLINKRSVLARGDIIMASIGNVGDAYLLRQNPKGWDINESVFALKPNTAKILPEYLYFFITHKQTQQLLESLSTGSSFKSIKMAQLKSIPVRIPVMSEQKKITDFLINIDDKIQAEERKLVRAKEFKKALLQQMFV